MHSWVIDNMPVTWCYMVASTGARYCTPKFPIGCHIRKDGSKQEACFISVSDYLCVTASMY